jgi:glycosyltransferase involved in cell wall biosynthesis
MVFTTLLCDVSRFGLFPPLNRRWLYEKCRQLYYCVFVRVMNVIVVHSTVEVDLYSRVFRVPPSRFRFVPYCVRSDAMQIHNWAKHVSLEPYVLAAGRNRDFRTFIAAIQATSFRGMIIGGADDRVRMGHTLPSNIEARFEIPFDQYRAFVAGAAILVVPLVADRMARSLGQITMFEAIARHVPVIAARTFQVTDYFADEREMLFYDPENADDLRRQIERLMMNPELSAFIAKNARARMLAEYTDEQYTQSLLQLCA